MSSMYYRVGGFDPSGGPVVQAASDSVSFSTEMVIVLIAIIDVTMALGLRLMENVADPQDDTCV